MKLLLDTHTLLWYVLGLPRLSTTAQRLMINPANEILISPVSYWEIAIKVSIGKFLLHQSYEDFMDVCLNQYRFAILPIEPQHTARVAVLPFPQTHKDPFDRLLIAQALVEKLPIVSAGTAFDLYGVTRLW